MMALEVRKCVVGQAPDMDHGSGTRDARLQDTRRAEMIVAVAPAVQQNAQYWDVAHDGVQAPHDIHTWGVGAPAAQRDAVDGVMRCPGMVEAAKACMVPQDTAQRRLVAQSTCPIWDTAGLHPLESACCAGHRTWHELVATMCHLSP